MEEVIGKLTTLIRDELAESQVNKENNSAEYRLGKNEAYAKILSVNRIRSSCIELTVPSKVPSLL